MIAALLNTCSVMAQTVVSTTDTFIMIAETFLPPGSARHQAPAGHRLTSAKDVTFEDALRSSGLASREPNSIANPGSAESAEARHVTDVATLGAAVIMR
jgi:hypothetical protein